MSAIGLINVTKIFGFGDATTVALDDINLRVEKGEFLAIMGPSGSGKSTLLNIIGMLDRPSHGVYQLDTRVVSRLRSNQRAKARRDHIGFIFQSFNLLPRMTVLENVALPLAYKGGGTIRRLKRSSVMLEKVGLKKREYYFPRQLSGGQAQRVAIARALINKPSIVIADEPTGNLDSASSKQIMELLRDINRGGNTIIMVTHNAELTAYASRVIYLRDGQIQHDQELAHGEVVNLKKIKAAEEYDSEVDQDIKETRAKDKLENKKARTKASTPSALRSVSVQQGSTEQERTRSTLK
jgi:putative ABC transport system ATP-binding protein